MAGDGSAVTTYVALLRGINVGGHNKVPMKELRDLCLELGFKNPRTVVASGNLVFESALKSAPTVRKKLEEGVKAAFSVSNPIFVLSAQEFQDVLEADPFDPVGKDGNKLMVMFVPKAATAAAQKAFAAAHQGPELVEFGSRAVYIYYSEGAGRSKLDLSKIVEPGTTRNRNTLAKIQRLIEREDGHS